MYFSLANFVVQDKNNLASFWLIGLYAPKQNNEKGYFWNDLASFFSTLQMPWCFIGDFDELLQISDKNGGNLGSTNRC